MYFLFEVPEFARSMIREGAKEKLHNYFLLGKLIDCNDCQPVLPLKTVKFGIELNLDIYFKNQKSTYIL